MEETYQLIRLAQTGDADARERLVRENSGLIWSVVGRFRGRGEPEDLYQIGAIGLLKCIEKFNFDYGVKFSTYAVPMMLGEIQRFLRDDGRVKVSRGLKELARKAKKLQEQSLQAENRELTIGELAARLEAEKEEVLLALEATREVESLYAPTDGRDGDFRMLDLLADSTKNDGLLERISLMEALERLSARQRQIIVLRYFREYTQADVAKCIGISQVQVSRIERRVLSLLREYLGEKG